MFALFVEQVSSLAAEQISSRMVLIEEHFTTTYKVFESFCLSSHFTLPVYPVNYSAGNYLKLPLKLMGNDYLQSN